MVLGKRLEMLIYYFVDNEIFISMFSLHHMPYSYAETIPLMSRLIMRAFGGNEDI